MKKCILDRFLMRRLLLLFLLSVASTAVCQQGVEHRQIGFKCLDLILQTNPDLVVLFDKFRENDVIGDTVTYDYGQLGRFSSTTLRSIKTASDLKQRFKDLSQMHIVEIGGDGGLCKILNELTTFASYTIVNQPECHPLAKKYFSGIHNARCIDYKDIAQLGLPDLVISHNCSAQFDSVQQEMVEYIIRYTPNGYITTNSIPLEEFIHVLHQNRRKGIVQKEHPSTDPNTVLIAWQQDVPLEPIQERKILHSLPGIQRGHAVSYHLGSRLGDNLLSYLHARWFAYIWNLPFHYIPFRYSDQFCLADLDQPLDSSFIFKDTVQLSCHTVELSSQNKMPSLPDASLLICPYAPEYRFEFDWTRFYWLPVFQIDWDDPGFRAEMHRCLTPKQPISTIELPTDRITVGIHVRRGGGVDPVEFYRQWPLKFPPDDYYIQQIKTIAKIFPNQPLYVYILTDDRNPETIVQRYTAMLNNPHIQLDCRRERNGPDVNVLEDFFLLQKFDCLVIAQSNFSIAASRGVDFALLIVPIHVTFIDDQPVIDEIELIFNGTKTTPPIKQLGAHEREIILEP